MVQGIVTRIGSFTLTEEDFPFDFNVEERHPVFHLRYIDFAAQLGNLSALQLFVEEWGASLADKRGSSFSCHLIFHAFDCEAEDKREAIFNWLKERKRYEALRAGVTARHMEALTDPNFLPQPHDTRDDLGLFPFHYFLLGNSLANEQKLQALTPATLDYFTHRLEGYFTGIDFSYLMAMKNMRLFKGILGQHPQIIKSLDLNLKIEYENNLNSGMSRLLHLAFEGELSLLNTLLNSQPNMEIDLSAQFEHEASDRKGVSLSGRLAYKNQWDLFNKIAERNGYDIPLDSRLIKSILDAQQYILLARVIISKNEKIPVNDTEIIAAICHSAGAIEREFFIDFFEMYDDQERSLLLADKEIGDYVRVGYILQSLLILTKDDHPDYFKSYIKELVSLFQHFHALCNKAFKKEYTVQVAQIIILIKEIYRLDSKGLRDLLHTYPGIIHHISSSPQGLNTPHTLGPFAQLDFEYTALLPKASREYALHQAAILHKQEKLEKELAELKQKLERTESLYRAADSPVEGAPRREEALLFLDKKQGDPSDSAVGSPVL